MTDNKTVFEYTEKHHILEVDGKEYEIPQRTAELEEKIREHDKKLAGMSEYDGNMELLEILFGKKAAAQMFPEKQKTNLDKLAKCVKLSLALFMADYNLIQTEDIEKNLARLSPVFDKIEEIQKTMSRVKQTAKRK